MKLLPVVVLLAIASVAVAKEKHSDSDYQDGVLVSFRSTVTGSNCSASEKARGSVSNSGAVESKSEGSGSCSNITTRLYTVKIGENMFEIEALPVTWNRANALENQLPGYRFRVRTEKGEFYIKIGNRETAFEVREAH
jgi:ubiquitin